MAINLARNGCELLEPTGSKTVIHHAEQFALQPQRQRVDLIQYQRPLPTAANLPGRSRSAPVNAPLTCPNNSLSIRLGDNELQSTTNKRARLAGETCRG